MPRQIHFVPQHPNDHDVGVIDQIDDVVLGVMVDAHRRIVLAAFGRDLRIRCNDVDRLTQTSFITVGLVAAEILESIEIAVDDVGFGLDREPNLHLLRRCRRAAVPRPISRRLFGH